MFISVLHYGTYTIKRLLICNIRPAIRYDIAKGTDIKEQSRDGLNNAWVSTDYYVQSDRKRMAFVLQNW